MATQPSIPAWKIPMERGAWWAAVHEVSESDSSEQQNAQHTLWGWKCKWFCGNTGRNWVTKGNYCESYFNFFLKWYVTL